LVVLPAASFPAGWLVLGALVGNPPAALAPGRDVPKFALNTHQEPGCFIAFLELLLYNEFT
jgi:hypothetical protein